MHVFLIGCLCHYCCVLWFSDGKNGKPASRATSRQSLRAQDTTLEAPEAVKYSERDDGGRSWTLEHVTEIVYLATQIQMSQQISEAIRALEAGERLTLEVRHTLKCLYPFVR